MPDPALPSSRHHDLKKWATIAMMVLAIGVGVSAVYRAGPYGHGDSVWGSKVHRTDLTAYIAAGQAVLDHTNIYDAHNVRGWYYTAWPIFSLVMVPFAMIGVMWSALIWYVLSLGLVASMILVSSRLAVRFFPSTALGVFWISAITALLIARPLMSGLARGQPSLPAMSLAVLAIGLFLRRRESWAGCALAGSIVLKIFPGLLVVYFAVKRRWFMTIMASMWLILMVGVVPSMAFGIRGNVDLLWEWVQRIGMPANVSGDAQASIMYSQLLDPRILRNQSIQAVTVRLVEGSDKDDPNFNPSPLTYRMATAVCLVLFLISAWACRRGRADRHDPRTALEIGVVIALMMLISPVVWTHYHVVLAMPLAIALAIATKREDDGERRVMRWAVSTFALLTFVSLPIEPLQAWGGPMWAILSLWAGSVWVLCKQPAAMTTRQSSASMATA